MTHLPPDSSNTPRREEILISPVLYDGDMDEWDRKLHAESDRYASASRVNNHATANATSYNRVARGGVGRGIPIAHQQPQQYVDPLDGLSQALSSKTIARQVKYDVARAAMTKSGIPIPPQLTDELVDKIVCLLANELSSMSPANRVPSPGTMDGRSTIDTELMWSEVREMPDEAKIQATRPCVPGEDPAQIVVKQRLAKKAESLRSNPIRPLPTSHVVGPQSMLLSYSNSTHSMGLAPFGDSYNGNNNNNNSNNSNWHHQHEIVGKKIGGLGKGSVSMSASSVFSECGSTCSNGQSSAFSSGGSGGQPAQRVWK